MIDQTLTIHMPRGAALRATDYRIPIRGKRQTELAAEIVRSARNRLRWQGGFDPPLDCDFSQPCGTTAGTLTVSADDSKALFDIAGDAVKYYAARSQSANAKAAQAIHDKIHWARAKAVLA